jgi:peptidoglycan/LPS O-acetylase OafA/YrhL
MSDVAAAPHGGLAAAVDGGLDEPGSAPGDRRFRPDVQGLRALAVALVVAFHAGVPGFEGGFVGVDVFFVVSGFVITGLVLRERTTGTFSFAGFWARRARRILPMATLVLLATVAASYLVLGRYVGRQVAADGRYTAVFAANLHAIAQGTSYFASTGPVSPLLHYWSLAVEEQFYVVFPLLVGLGIVVRVRSLRRWLGTALALVAAASLALSIWQTATAPLVAYFSPLTRAWELAAGGLVAIASVRCSRLPRTIALVASWAGLAGIVVAALAFGPATSYPGVAALLPVGATCLVIVAGTAVPGRGAERVLGTRIGLVGGDLSYSLYLWHFPVLVIAAEAMTTPLSALERAGLVVVAVVLAIGSRHVVEDPVRRARRLRASATASLGLGAGLVVGSLVILTVLVHVTAPPRTTAVPHATSPSLAVLRGEVAAGTMTRAVPATVAPPLGPPPASLSGPLVPDRCWVGDYRQTTIDPCAFGDLASSRTVLLLGDSTAAMWSGAFVTLAEAHHDRLVLLAKTDCAPWLTRDLIFRNGPDPWCSSWHRFEVAEAARLHPTAIVVTGFLGLPANPDRVRAGVDHLLGDLRAITPDVTVLSNLPAVPPGSLDPASCVLVHSTDVAPCNLSVAAFDAAYGSFRAALVDGAHATGATFVDLDPLLCTATTCPVVVAHHLVYRDLFHLNTAYVAYVTTPLGTLLGSGPFSPARA